MDAALHIGFATTGATLLVTVGLFAWDRAASRASAKRELKRQLVARVLDAFESSTRSLIRPAFVQAWTNAELEYTLLLPRLLLDLNGRDRFIALWMHRQIQLMRLAVTKRERVAARAVVAERLIEWNAGTRKSAWFAQQVREDPPSSRFAVPTPTRIRQFSRDSWAWAQLLAAMAAVGVLIKSVVSK
ncbi:hypothetical protein [Homoserinibacter sp. YIM 151385]|uniref:hypothetical protein n=1 Tax=Homoserinibacter sp. YIM 151385 TaxID=2985506 RepID=UPI0022F0F83A|nr:hypothetical protein [Homoserinibacter sp. YIM 151385]WBU36705.1 hypothetical protein OF852_07075 [Homoserinibacter sp. YIM 151385]